MDRSNYECFEKQRKAYFPHEQRSNQVLCRLRNGLDLKIHNFRLALGTVGRKRLATRVRKCWQDSCTWAALVIRHELLHGWTHLIFRGRKIRVGSLPPLSARRVLCRLLTSIFAVRPFLLVSPLSRASAFILSRSPGIPAVLWETHTISKSFIETGGFILFSFSSSASRASYRRNSLP